jgi:hypothetical protein
MAFSTGVAERETDSVHVIVRERTDADLTLVRFLELEEEDSVASSCGFRRLLKPETGVGGGSTAEAGWSGESAGLTIEILFGSSAVVKCGREEEARV